MAGIADCRQTKNADIFGWWLTGHAGYAD
jgi:hypothetical protein